MHRSWLFRILVLIAFHQQLASIVPVSAQELRRVRVAVTSPGMTNLSLYIADRRGRFTLWSPVPSNSARRLLIR